MSKLSDERIDVSTFTLRPMSNNLPGHEARMEAHCKRVQREYLDLRGKDGRFIKNKQPDEA